MIIIKNWTTGFIIYQSDDAKTVLQAVVEAVKCGADLCCAYLHGADLSGARLRGARLSGARLSGADLRGARLNGADLSGADLRSARLHDVDLSGARLRDADLNGADLSGARLRIADLSRADLSSADLRGADLSGANLSGVPVIANIHQAVYNAVSVPDALDMDQWHTCETTHCRGGWVINLAGAGGAALECEMGTSAAAALIYMASDPCLEKIPDFHCDNETALIDMKRLADKEAEAQST